MEHAHVPVVAKLEPIRDKAVAFEDSQSEGLVLPSTLILTDATVAPAHVDFETADSTTLSLADAEVYQAVPTDVPTPTTPIKSAKTSFVADITSEVPPLLQNIGYCESGNRQFDSQGNVIRGRVNRYDVGKYQINEKYWLAEANRLGINIYTEAGNTAMALEIYRRHGSQPWSSSKPCWGN